jgi:hypothetical protein
VRTDRRRLTGFVADALAIDWLMWADDEVVTTMIRRGPLIVSFHRRQPVIVSLIRLYGEWPAGICTSVLFINSMEALILSMSSTRGRAVQQSVPRLKRVLGVLFFRRVTENISLRTQSDLNAAGAQKAAFS